MCDLASCNYRTDPNQLQVPDSLKVGFSAASRVAYEDPDYNELSEMNALGMLDPQHDLPFDVL
jgi:hypothetical protein